MDVANLEAAFERVTVTDENDEQISSSTTSYHKTKVHNAHSNTEIVN
jgi:aurora kinase